MDFQDSPEEAAFRAEVRQWLELNAPSYDIRRAERLPLPQALERARSWQRLKAERGFAKITWPGQFGGISGTPMQQVIYQQEESRYQLPVDFFKVSLGMPVPIMRRFANPEQQVRYIAPAVRGDEIWCQLFSEPGAGSDLAAVSTRAVRDGEDWILNGQKVWTSWAHISDFGVIIARSSPDKPKHKGITYFFLDMKSPGIEVRTIQHLGGGREFNEVFFTDVRVPDSQRLGEIDEGWKVALATLMEERFSVVDVTGGGPGIDHLIELCRGIELEGGQLAINDGEVRERIADWYVVEQGLKANYYRQLTTLSRGQLPGVEAAINKIYIPSKLQQMSKFALDLMGPAGVLAPANAKRSTEFFVGWLEASGYRIAGGTDEILRNTIAEQVLKLPADVRLDKNVPFNQL